MISEDEKTHQIAVRKSKDLNNCHERVIKDIGLSYTETCVECQQVISIAKLSMSSVFASACSKARITLNQFIIFSTQRLKSLTGTATFSYIMKPTEKGALVSEAVVEEVHQFSLFDTETGAAQMKAKYDLLPYCIYSCHVTMFSEYILKHMF